MQFKNIITGLALAATAFAHQPVDDNAHDLQLNEAPAPSENTVPVPVHDHEDKVEKVEKVDKVDHVDEVEHAPVVETATVDLVGLPSDPVEYNVVYGACTQTVTIDVTTYTAPLAGAKCFVYAGLTCGGPSRPLLPGTHSFVPFNVNSILCHSVPV